MSEEPLYALSHSHNVSFCSSPSKVEPSVFAWSPAWFRVQGLGYRGTSLIRNPPGLGFRVYRDTSLIRNSPPP